MPQFILTRCLRSNLADTETSPCSVPADRQQIVRCGYLTDATRSVYLPDIHVQVLLKQ